MHILAFLYIGMTQVVKILRVPHVKKGWLTRTILCIRPANERRRYNVTSSLPWTNPYTYTIAVVGLIGNYDNYILLLEYSGYTTRRVKMD